MSQNNIKNFFGNICEYFSSKTHVPKKNVSDTKNLKEELNKKFDVKCGELEKRLKESFDKVFKFIPEVFECETEIPYENALLKYTFVKLTNKNNVDKINIKSSLDREDFQLEYFNNGTFKINSILLQSNIFKNICENNELKSSPLVKKTFLDICYICDKAIETYKDDLRESHLKRMNFLNGFYKNMK